MAPFPRQDTAELFFEDVRLPASALLGELNKGFYYLMKELPQVRDKLTVVLFSKPVLARKLIESNLYNRFML